MTDDASLEAAGDEAGGPLPAAPVPGQGLPEAPAARRSIFALRAVTPLSPEERAARAAAMERSLAFGAEPVRDKRGWALEVDFIEANGEAVEPWKHDRRDKRLYKRNQKVTKAAGQLIGQPGDKIELAKRYARVHHREGSDIEGAVRRGLFDAIWRYDHVYDGYTVPRRYGTHFMKTGRVAAVAEEQRRKWIAEGRAPADAFWVRNRRNTGLVLVSPNPDPDAPVEVPAESPGEILGEEGVETVTGEADIDTALESFQPADDFDIPTEAYDPRGLYRTKEADDSGNEPLRFDYSNIPITLDQNSTKTTLSDGSAAQVINLEKDRIANILADEPAIFEIADSSTASGREPILAFHDKGYWAVRDHEDLIEKEAKSQGVDPDLVKAIMYVENAHGASYGHPFEALGVSETILPMNINPETWSGLMGEEEDFTDARVNVRAGVKLIRRIQERLKEPTVAKAASIYVFSGRENVNDYGARVAEVYAQQEWQRLPREMVDSFIDQIP